MLFTFYGHACFSLEIGDKHLVFDPFIIDNPLANSINIDYVACDYILLSHAHSDHSADVLYLANKNKATLISNYECCIYFEKQGLKKYHPMNTGGKWNFPFGTVISTFAQHSSSFADGTYGGIAGGFIIKTDKKCVYFAGDTSLTQEMKLLGELYKFDYIILPIGGNFTMDIDDAILASNYLNCSQVIGIHYDTFGFIKINKQNAIDKFKAQNKSLILLPIGASKHL